MPARLERERSSRLRALARSAWRFAAAVACTLPSARGAVDERSFVGAAATTAQSHASTLVETRAGSVLAAWFGGTAERAPDVRIWLSKRLRAHPDAWSAARPVADGVQPDGTRLPTWNPVLFQPRDGPLMLFYKVGADPQHWWGMLTTSADDGAHWSPPKRLPDGLLGPIRSKPVQLDDGSIVAGSSTEDGAWRVHFERSGDGGASWQRIAVDPGTPPIDAIQPSVVTAGRGRLIAFARTRQDRIAATRSDDGGRHWQALHLIDLPNPNAGIEALRLRDGRLLLVYNPGRRGANWWDGRDRLALALSDDDGVHWHAALELDDAPGQELSYPAAIQTRDGQIHISYTWKRQRIRHVVLAPSALR